MLRFISLVKEKLRQIRKNALNDQNMAPDDVLNFLYCSEQRKTSLFSHDTIIVVEEFSANLSKKEDVKMDIIFYILLAIEVEILVHYICKWLDRK